MHYNELSIIDSNLSKALGYLQTGKLNAAVGGLGLQWYLFDDYDITFVYAMEEIAWAVYTAQPLTPFEKLSHICDIYTWAGILFTFAVVTITFNVLAIFLPRAFRYIDMQQSRYDYISDIAGPICTDITEVTIRKVYLDTVELLQSYHQYRSDGKFNFFVESRCIGKADRHEGGHNGI